MQMGKGNFHKHYNWEEVQTYYDLGFSSQSTAGHFKMSTASITKAARRGDFKFRDKSAAASLGHKNRVPHSTTTKAKLSRIATDRKFGGRNFRKTYYYEKNGEIVILESSWELNTAVALDKEAIRWIRPTPFRYFDDVGKERRYYPDFYLPDYDIYLDPKNEYLRTQDRRKIELVERQNGVRILVLSREDLGGKNLLALLHQHAGVTQR